MRVLPSSVVRELNSEDSNCRPLSVVIDAGSPNAEIHLSMNALATVSAVMSVIGTASGQRVYLSTHVRI